MSRRALFDHVLHQVYLSCSRGEVVGWWMDWRAEAESLGAGTVWRPIELHGATRGGGAVGRPPLGGEVRWVGGYMRGHTTHVPCRTMGKTAHRLWLLCRRARDCSTCWL